MVTISTRRGIYLSAPNHSFPKAEQIAALRILVAEHFNRAAPCNAPHNPGGRHEVTNTPTSEHSMLGAIPIASSYFRRLPVLGRCPTVQL